ncbi:hypothetical protein M404DRAFT_29782 [Pisolithus tinctorius Marx 270]|uniref:Uncharacterized protein n=1 Tax=Pisolithus tinctorius Marx 270 TaxID=870435 RepID=A0A0C3ITD5_PISTI|nr:hypothetical protein M404DRAFT_29782 [Pisolithus tinctorius Marx 270]
MTMTATTNALKVVFESCDPRSFGSRGFIYFGLRPWKFRAELIGSTAIGRRSGNNPGVIIASTRSRSVSHRYGLQGVSFYGLDLRRAAWRRRMGDCEPRHTSYVGSDSGTQFAKSLNVHQPEDTLIFSTTMRFDVYQVQGGS